MRTASPNRDVTDSSWASLAALTVLSTETSTWLVTGSTAHAVPAMRAELLNAPVAWLSWAAVCLTTRGTAPAARTCAAADGSVIVTTIWPLAGSR
jgi:hypothetical protein